MHKELEWRLHNTRFYGQMWTPQHARGVVAIVHGMGEHSGRYKDFVAPTLVDAGYAVVAFDHFGHGKTEGKRGHCPSYEAVLDSVDKLMDKVNDLFPDIPHFIYGHSMGGNVVANYLIKRNPQLVGAILSSPMLRLAFDPPKWKMVLGRYMLKIYPAFTEKTGLDASAISRDPKAVDAYINDPLVHDSISTMFAIPFFQAGEYAIEHAGEIEIPVFLFHGTGDRITAHKATEEFASKAKKNVELVLFDQAYHEIHNDLVKDALMEQIIAWMDQVLENKNDVGVGE